QALQYEQPQLGISVQPNVLDTGHIQVKLGMDMKEIIWDSPVPSFVTRSITDTVELRNGETVVLAGLLRQDALWPLTPWDRFAADPSTGSFVVLLGARLIE